VAEKQRAFSPIGKGGACYGNSSSKTFGIFQIEHVEEFGESTVDQSDGRSLARRGEKRQHSRDTRLGVIWGFPIKKFVLLWAAL
jgi:hypothetical protein